MNFCRCNCNKRKSAHPGAFCLTEAKAGTSGKVVSLACERKSRCRIVSLGINVGTELKVLKNSHGVNGSIILKILDSILVLNNNVASKIDIVAEI